MTITKMPDSEEIEQAIKENQGYCPCKVGRIPENKCMCQMFKEQEHGLCECGLYYKSK